MPNTLAHIGTQALASFGVSRRPDPKWIYLGCTLPDVPWILARIGYGALPERVYEVRLYATAQAALLPALLLCAAFATLAAWPRRVFGILAASSLLHFGIDAAQTKWGNGVHLLAPFSWRITNWGWFWPESAVTYGLTALGAAAVALALSGRAQRPIPLRLDLRRGALAAALLGAYAVVPLAMKGGAESADSHFVRTLRDRESRAGRPIALDRASYGNDAEGSFVLTHDGEPLRVTGVALPGAGSVSFRGRFVDAGTLVVEEHHLHRWPRDLASVAGLACIAVVVAASLWRESRGEPRGAPR